MPLDRSGKASQTISREPGDLPDTKRNVPSGVTATRSMNMITQTQSSSTLLSGIGAAFVIAFMGIALMVVTGHVQSATLHDAAHDMRHASGFPCH
jgi:cobalt transporter subunit CbtB